MKPRSKNIFQNRHLVNKIMYGLAIAMVLGMLVFTIGPALFGSN